MQLLQKPLWWILAMLMDILLLLLLLLLLLEGCGVTLMVCWAHLSVVGMKGGGATRGGVPELTGQGVK